MTDEKNAGLLPCPLCAVSLIPFEHEGYEKHPLDDCILRGMIIRKGDTRWNTRAQPDAGAAVAGDVVDIDSVIQDICELSDRTSPEDQPDMMLVTADELRGIIEQNLKTPTPSRADFQSRVQPWMMACFGAEISADGVERNHRFIEEALELVQACGATKDECHQLVDYVYGRPVGEKNQEVGGVMVTLAALCLAHGLDMHAAGETELARIWGKVEQIRAKQAAKPKHSPLPESALKSAPPKPDDAGRLAALKECHDVLIENGVVFEELIKICGDTEGSESLLEVIKEQFQKNKASAYALHLELKSAPEKGVDAEVVKILNEIAENDTRESHPCGPQLYGLLGDLALKALALLADKEGGGS